MILQVNMRWKALAEVYKMHSFAPFLESKFDRSLISMFLFKIAETVAENFAEILLEFSDLLLNFANFLAKICRNSLRIGRGIKINQKGSKRYQN